MYEKPFNQVFDTFSPQIATMLAFIFSDKLRTSGKQRQQTNKFVAVLAIALSAVYILFFCYIMSGFYVDKYSVVDVVRLFELIRPKTSFLIAGLIAYYFATKT